MFGKKTKNILVTGNRGQLGSYLEKYFKDKSMLQKSCIGKVFGIDKDDVDIRIAVDVLDFFKGKSKSEQRVHFDYVIHCAAMTDTTAIERDPYGDSYDVNVIGADNIAKACIECGSKMIFISTDYVMSEHSWTYGVWNAHPVNQYGMQKLIAEQMLKNRFSHKPKDLLIARSSWMFGNSHRSFIEKILSAAFKLYAKGKDLDCDIELKVADDAYGMPTPVWLIADLLHSVIDNGIAMDISPYGVDFLARPYSCVISRCQWAQIILDAFCEMAHNDSLSANLDEFKQKFNVDSFAEKIKVIPTSFSELGLSMRHPGYIGFDNKATYDNDFVEYANATKRHISSNLQWFIDEAVAAVDNEVK